MGGLQGPVRFGLASAPDRWWLKAVMVDGINAVEHAVHVGPGAAPRTDVRVVLSSRSAALSGRVTGERREPVANAALVVWPVDPLRWTGWPAHVRLSHTDTDGGVTVNGLPPGEYWVAAVTGLEDQTGSGEWQTPATLGRLVAVAHRVTLGEDDRRSLDLRATQLR